MSENITMTRISDLPEMGSSTPTNMAPTTDMYMPMNIHPNPYGIAQQPEGGLPLPQQTQGGGKQYENTMYSNQMMKPDEVAMMQEMPRQRLPQRDIPMDTDTRMHDEQIHANYIPKPKLKSNYIEDYEEIVERKNKEYESKKKRETIQDNWFDELQTPILIGILFFIFHLPIVNSMIFKRFSFLSIYKEDGNFNFTGLLLKCSLFTSTYYFIEKTMKYVSEF